MTKQEKKEIKERFEMRVKTIQESEQISYIEAYKYVINDMVESIKQMQDTVDYMRELFYLYPEHKLIIVDIGKTTKEMIEKDKQILEIL